MATQTQQLDQKKEQNDAPTERLYHHADRYSAGDHPLAAQAVASRQSVISQATLGSSQNAETIADYPTSIQRLIRTLTTFSSLTPAQLKSVIEDVGVSAYDLVPWADFNHSLRDSYGRKMVHHGGHFEVMVMSWVPGDFSAIHDHGHAQWGAVQCFGEADHYVYTLEDAPAGKRMLKDPVAAHYQYGDIRTVDHYTVHQMGNGGDKPFLSLHVYGCERPEISITENARVFDLLEESAQFTNGGVFFCLPEHKIEQRQYGVTGDIATVSMQYILMRDRMRRILEVESDVRMEQKLAWLERRMRQ